MTSPIISSSWGLLFDSWPFLYIPKWDNTSLVCCLG